MIVETERNRAWTPRLAWLAAALAIHLAACRDAPPAPVGRADATPAAGPPAVASSRSGIPGAPAQPATNPAMPPGPGSFAVPPPSTGTGTGASGLVWSVPKGWLVEEPASSLRRAQYRAPGPGGDAECVVFYFGPGQGGDAMSNVGRWGGQFHQPDGQPVTAQTRTIETGAVPVLLVELRGTYVGGMGTTQGEKAGYALLGAVAKGPDANWFFKLTGPEKTIEARRAAFEAMVRSLKKGA